MIILVGASASGKTEVCKELCKTYHYKKFVTTTTREKRVNEADGVDYFFVDKDKFIEKIKNNDFIEYTKYDENYYGSEKKEINDNSVIIVDPLGLKAFNTIKNKRFISYYLECDDNVRKERMIKRGDSIEKINERLKFDKEKFNLNLVNTTYQINTTNKSIKEIACFINKTYKTMLSSLN